MGKFSVNDLKRKVRFPNKNINLAEFFGILTGDGFMNIYRKYDYVIEIAGNKLSDKSYLKVYLTNLIKKLFNIIPRYIERNDQNSIYLRICSKAVFNYLLEKGFKKGRKGFIGIPLWIRENKEFMRYFVRGLFDTDGCISIKNKEGTKYPTISISSKSNKLLNIVRGYLEDRGINCVFMKQIDNSRKYSHEVIRYKIEINGYKNLQVWFNLIKSSNDRNIKKYRKAIDFLNKRNKDLKNR